MSLTSGGLSDTDYHAGPALSATGARKLLACPARYRWERDHPPASTAAFDLGKLAHKLILGEGADVVEIDAPDWRGKAARDARDEARTAGKIPCLASEFAAAAEMTESVYRHPKAAELFADGKGRAELSGFWTDELTGTPLRFRPDWLTLTTCVDVKTTVSADPAEFARSVVKFGYHIQAAWYLAGLAAVGHAAQRFLFVCVEKTPPYPVSVIELDGEAITEGARLARKAIDLYAQCSTTDTWPAYGDGVHWVSLPSWAYREANNEAASNLINDLERIGNG